MPGFDSVIGLEEVVDYLQNIIKSDKVAQTYIFYGEKGTGKKLLSGILAMTLQCEKHGIEPCLECSSCKKAETRNHPDIITVYHEKPASIGIDEIRAQLVDDILIRPECSPYKIYIVPEAEKMTTQAQNALLKTLADLPKYAKIFLLTDNVDMLLPTIRSRCVHLAMRLVSEPKVKKYLMDACDVPDYYAELDAAYAQGNIGKARDIATSGEFHSRVDTCVEILSRSYHMPMVQVNDCVKRLTEEKADIDEYLELFTMWFRDILLFKATAEVDKLVFRRQLDMIKKRASQSSYEGLQEILNAIEKVKTRLKSNVNFELSIELLLLTIREN